MSNTAHLIDKHEGYTIVKFNQELDYNQSKKFEADIEGLIKNDTNYIVVDCESVGTIPMDCLRTLLKLHLHLKKDNKFVRLYHVSPVLMTYLKKEGVDTTFKITKDIKDALAETGFSPKKGLDAEFVNPFLSATIHVLKVQAQVEAKSGPLHVKKSGEPQSGDVSGVIGIVSDSFNGSVVISFPEATFLKVMSQMLGEEYKEISKDIIDGAGELTNMIFGQAKIILNEKGYGIKTAIPSVISGKNHSLSALTKGPVVVVPFETNAGPFFCRNLFK